jgi:GntR family transcriptional regulator of arabinose operon
LEELQHKYETLYHYLKNEILNGNFQYGDKIPPENDLATKFLLSRFTVRHAIDILANEGFLEKRHGSGTYVKATNPNRNRTSVIGIITTYLDDYIFPSIIRGIESVLTLHGFSLNLGITENKTSKETACLRGMLAQNVDGLIIEGTKSALFNPNVGLLETFSARGIPVVFINGDYSDYDSSCVLMDDEMSGQMVAQYLIDNGHRKIGGIFKSDDIQGHRRYRGMEKAMQLGALSLEENSLLWYTTENLEQIFRTEYDHLLLRRFNGCTALICYNDQIAMKVIRTFERNGIKIPEDISVIGFDNSELCEVSPIKLTSVTHARSAMGEAAANMIMEILAQKNHSAETKKLCIPSILVPRNSVRNLLLPKK